MNSTQNLSLELNQTVAKKSCSTVDILRLIFPEWIVRKYWKRRKTYSFYGVLLGALLLTVLIQTPATAQLFQDAEANTNVIQAYIPGLGSALAFFFQSVRLIFLGGGFAGVGGGLYAHVTNRGWENWLPIGTALLVAGALLFAVEQMIYGGVTAPTAPTFEAPTNGG